MSTVVLEEVARTFESEHGDVHALGPLSFSIGSGERVGVVGPSGCGKSTLLRIVAGIDLPSSGTVTVGGQAVSGPLSAIGMVFQRDLLLDWRTVMGNVMLTAEFQGLERPIASRRALELLEALGVAAFAQRRPWELSGGMRQRVAIARALLARPSMLLLDEPFSALDALTRDQMNVLLQRVEISERVTTLLITHSIAEAVFLSDRVLVLSSRPGTVLDDIPIPFSHPRHLSVREDPKFTAIAKRIRVRFEEAGILVA